MKTGLKSLLVIVVSFTATFFSSSKISAQTTISATGSGTWTNTLGHSAVFVEFWGAGGGGSSVSGTAGGGGGGAYVKLLLTGLSSSSAFTYNVGAGGSVGNSGGNTTITYSSSTYQANAGGSSATLSGGSGGAAATITGIVVASYSGGNGGSGRVSTSGANNEAGGGGGGSANVSANGSSGSNGGLSNSNRTSGGGGFASGGGGAASDGNPDAQAGGIGAGGGGRAEGGGTSKAGGNGQIIITPATSRYSVATGNWSATSTWSFTSGGSSGAPVPTSSDDVFIQNNGAVNSSRTITVNQNANAKSIGFSENENNNNLNLNSGITLTVAGNVTFPRAGGDNTDNLNIINVGSGTLNVTGNFAYTSTGTSARAQLKIGSGTMKVDGNFTTDDNAKSSPYLEIGSGLLRIGGVFLPQGDISLVAGTGTVEYFGASQAIANHSYANLSLSGSGTKTFPALANVPTPTTTNNPIWTIQELKIFSGVTVSLSYPGTAPTSTANRAYKVAELFLWESGSLVGQNLGSYKGTGTRTSDPFTSAVTKTALGTSTGVFTSAQAALPVTLSSFTAKPTPDNKVSLAWVTSTEQVNKGFRIERQAGDANVKFEQIGFVGSKAKDGNSQNTLTYNFTDAAPKVGAASFYRLVQEDLDGKLTYTEVRLVKLNGQSVSMVFPNPSIGAVNISRTADGKKMNIQVIDQSGKIISQVNNIADANYKLSIPQSGVYTIKMTYPETGEQSIQRIVVQK